jgi:hypothetical protein
MVEERAAGFAAPLGLASVSSARRNPDARLVGIDPQVRRRHRGVSESTPQGRHLALSGEGALLTSRDAPRGALAYLGQPSTASLRSCRWRAEGAPECSSLIGWDRVLEQNFLGAAMRRATLLLLERGSYPYRRSTTCSTYS